MSPTRQIPGPPATRWTIGSLAPLVLVLGLVADAGSRFASFDGVAFRAWEAVQRFGATGRGGQFEPNKRYANEHAYGVTASMGNYPALRQYRREVFTTDAYGFRNLPAVAAVRPLAGLLFGTSFSAGCSLSDDETLPARLGALVGGTIYNGAGLDPSNEMRLDEILDRLDLHDGVVVSEYLESYATPNLTDVRSGKPGRMKARLQAATGARYRTFTDVNARVSGWLSISPLEVALRRARRAIEDDSFLPNSYASTVVRETLVNGDPVLFLRSEVDLARAPTRPAAPAVAFWQWLATRLAARRLRLLVVLVPTQYTVYGPLVAPPPAELGPDLYLEGIERGLMQAQVPVINLTEPFRRAARAGLNRHAYIYWRDDNHWNADGVNLAAQEIARRWPPAP